MIITHSRSQSLSQPVSFQRHISRSKSSSSDLTSINIGYNQGFKVHTPYEQELRTVLRYREDITNTTSLPRKTSLFQTKIAIFLLRKSSCVQRCRDEKSTQTLFQKNFTKYLMRETQIGVHKHVSVTKTCTRERHIQPNVRDKN